MQNQCCVDVWMERQIQSKLQHQLWISPHYSLNQSSRTCWTGFSVLRDQLICPITFYSCPEGKQCGTDYKTHSYCHKRLYLAPERRDILQPPVRSFEKPPYLRRSALRRRPSPCSGWRPLSGPLCCVAPRGLCRIRVRERAPAAAPPRTPPHPHRHLPWQRKPRHDGKGSRTNKPARVQTCCVWKLMWPEMWTKHWLDEETNP